MISPKRILIVALALGVLGLALALVVLWATNSKPGFANPPQPNGYKLLITAASKAQGPNPSKVTNNIGPFVEANRESLALTREAVRHSGESTAALHTPNSLMNDLQALRSLAHIVRLEALEHERMGEWDAAADCSVGIIRMGHIVQRGPLISALMGFSIESMGIKQLDALAPRVSKEKRKLIAGELGQILDEAVTMEGLVQRELYFTRRRSSIPSALIRMLPGFRKDVLNVEGKLNKIRADLESTRLKLLSPPPEKTRSVNEPAM